MAERRRRGIAQVQRHSDDTDRLRVVFAGISALILAVGLARFAYTPMLPVMRGQAGLSYLAGGWLAAFNYAGYITGALVAAMAAATGGYRGRWWWRLP
ncbi:MAG: YbfB/YjiJ family MFS transporter [Acidovorax sp.]|uniref:YbfB/YjiJ family MFS transporter n=1 Tax=Acidovorax sp. TaxID=1872122 RepID=UPI0039E5BA6E